MALAAGTVLNLHKSIIDSICFLSYTYMTMLINAILFVFIPIPCKYCTSTFTYSFTSTEVMQPLKICQEAER